MAANNGQHKVLIVGGGTAGITVAASLRRRAPQSVEITLVEPAEWHYYQPALTLVGAGARCRSTPPRSDGSPGGSRPPACR
jgi:sulfide:quinone oxidoreductase